MLLLPLKPAVRYEISLALAQWLESDTSNLVPTAIEDGQLPALVVPKPTYGAVTIRSELLRLQGIRNSLCDALRRSNSHKSAMTEFNGVADLMEYHAILVEFEKRGFPTSNDPNSPVVIPWKGAFDESSIEKKSTVLYDRVCVLFNLAALHCQQAESCSSSDRAECKTAVGCCQMAASMIDMCMNLVATSPTAISSEYASVDLSSGLLQFWRAYFLAEAQSFVYRMMALAPASSSTVDTTARQHQSLSVLAQSASELFCTALKLSKDCPRLQSEVPEQSGRWSSYCKAHSMLAASKAEYHAATCHRVNAAWGYELGYLRTCQLKLQDAAKFMKTLDYDNHVVLAKKEVTLITPVVVDRYEEASKDNYTIYQDTVPNTNAVIQPRQLSKLSATIPPAMLSTSIPMFTNVC